VRERESFFFTWQEHNPRRVFFSLKFVLLGRSITPVAFFFSLKFVLLDRSITPGADQPWDVEYLKESGLLSRVPPVHHLLPSPPPSTPPVLGSKQQRPRRVSADRASNAWASLSSPRVKK
jgi:hypothetical protein